MHQYLVEKNSRLPRRRLIQSTEQVVCDIHVQELEYSITRILLLVACQVVHSIVLRKNRHRLSYATILSNFSRFHI